MLIEAYNAICPNCKKKLPGVLDAMGIYYIYEEALGLAFLEGKAFCDCQCVREWNEAREYKKYEEAQND